MLEKSRCNLNRIGQGLLLGALFLVFLSAVYSQTSAAKTISSGILNGKALTLPKPDYPDDLKGVTGEIRVQVLIDETGKVVKASVVSGIDNLILRTAAIEAAKRSTFSPTLLSGVPTKVSGVIVYNFAGPKRNYEQELKYVVLAVMVKVTRTSADNLEKLNKSFESNNIFEEASADPEFANLTIRPELKRLASLDKLPLAKRIETIDSVSADIRAKLSGYDKWQWDVGESLGDAFGQFAEQFVSDAPSLDLEKIDQSAIRSGLAKLGELTVTAPTDVPREVLERLKRIAAMRNEHNLLDEKTLVVLVAKIGELMDIISPNDEK